ncbi:Zn(2)-C6 fungal-type domain-containing protein [Fusarium sp. LHS14.1]|nr:Zn(2)-C6 fungal-type domain-containing protein [Fusarium sp. LHS14.1]
MAPDSIAKRRACVSCTSAKLKCTPHANGRCERCSRLGKHCEYQNMPERRRKQRVTGRVEALESKIDGLMAQISHLTKQNEPQTGTASTSTVSSGGAVEDYPLDELVVDTQDATPYEPPVTVLDELIGTNEAESLINDFKSNWMAKFPFVVVELEKSAVDLHAHNPFLCLCILGVTMDFQHPLRKRIYNEIMDQITSKIIRNAERSLDLLQGLLVYAAWYRHPLHMCKREAVMFVQLCTTLVYDLDLGKKTGLTAEEQHAVLGTFWLSGSLRLMLNKPVGLSHSKQVDDCSRELEASTSCSSDPWAGHLVRLQSFMSRVDDDHHAHKTVYQSAGAEVLTQIFSIRYTRELEGLKSSVATVLVGSPKPVERLLQMEIECAELSTLRFCLVDSLWASESTAARRSTMLWRALKLSRSIIENLINTPEAEVRQTTFVTLDRVWVTFEILAKSTWALIQSLLGEKDQPVNQAAVRGILAEGNFLKLISEVRNRLEKTARNVPQADKELELFNVFHSRVKLFAKCYDKRIKDSTGVDPWEVGEDLVVEQSDDNLWEGGVDLRQEMADVPLLTHNQVFDQVWWNEVMKGFGRYEGA